VNFVHFLLAPYMVFYIIFDHIKVTSIIDVVVVLGGFAIFINSMHSPLSVA